MVSHSRAIHERDGNTSILAKNTDDYVRIYFDSCAALYWQREQRYTTGFTTAGSFYAHLFLPREAVVSPGASLEAIIGRLPRPP